MNKSIIAVPIGDAAGVGPEIVVKALGNPALSHSRLLVIGERMVIERALAICGSKASIHCVEDIREAIFEPGVINLLNMDNLDINGFRFGEISAICGKAAFAYIAKSIELSMANIVGAVATPPINKESFRLAGIDYIGHTEVFGSLTNTEDPLTMFEVRGMRVFFLTRHVSLKRSCDLITKDRIVSYGRRCVDALRKLGVDHGPMAVAGLNPHCGEHGLFGDEEGTQIEPAVKELQDSGYDVVGPVSADSVFFQALRGKYSSVLSLYHDQGHIACKTLDFDRTVSVTVGMPVLRTSVDHGTAFDIAGMGIASDVSMVESILVAEKYAPYYSKR